MVPPFARRPALTAAAVALVLAAAQADDPGPAEPPPPDHLRPAVKLALKRQDYLDSLAAAEPFDLTYLTRPPEELGCLVGFRPAAILAHPDAGPLHRLAEGVGGQFARTYLPAAGGVPLAGFEWVVLGGRPDLRFTENPNPAPGERPRAFMIGGHFECVVGRTREPQDWAADAARWFPGREPASHAGVPYFVLPGEAPRSAVYLPDARTAVLSSEDGVRALIDRLRAGRGVTPPVGWAAVARGLVAVSFDNRDKTAARSFPAGRGPRQPDPIGRLLGSADRFTVGIEAGRRTRLRVVAASRDPAAARVAAAAAGRFLGWFREVDAEEPGALFAGFLRGELTVRPLGFEYVADAPVDLIRELAAAVDRVMTPVHTRPDSVAPLPPPPPGVAAAPAPPPATSPAGLPPVPPPLSKGDWYSSGPALPVHDPARKP